MFYSFSEIEIMSKGHRQDLRELKCRCDVGVNSSSYEKKKAVGFFQAVSTLIALFRY